MSFKILPNHPVIHLSTNSPSKACASSLVYIHIHIVPGGALSWAVTCPLHSQPMSPSPGLSLAGPKLSPLCRFTQPEHTKLRMQHPVNRTCIFCEILTILFMHSLDVNNIY